MGKVDNGLDGRYGAQDVAHMRDGDHARAIAQRRREGIEIEATVVTHVHPAQHGALALAVKVPGDDVGVVLHDRQHDLVAFADARSSKALRHEVDCLSGGLGEDDFLAPCSVEEKLHRVAAALVSLRSPIGERVEATMHIGIFVPEGVIHPIEHLHRLLRRGTAIEIDQALAVDHLGKDGEVGTDFFEIEGHLFLLTSPPKER